ncbi:MAG: hypothetical protein HYZ83_01480 [Candidatus Omnitrophica bacterium]|nr:hypothetical protein [Candidatus Omnitrophota bacterium]
MLYHDAGIYLLEAKFLQEGADLVLQHKVSREIGFWNKIKKQTQGVPIHCGKPGWNLMLAASGLFLGFQDYLSAKITASTGVLILILVFILSKQAGGNRSAVYSMVFLASSTFYLIASRNGLPDQAASLFFISALILYFFTKPFVPVSSDPPSWKKNLLFYSAGFLMGFAFACNQWRTLYLFALLMGMVAARMLFEEKRFDIFSLIFIFSGFLTPIIAFQIPYWIVKQIAGPLPFRDYWQQLVERYYTKEGIIWFFSPGQLSQEFWKVEGPLFSSAVIFSWMFLSIRFFVLKRPQDLFLLFFSLIPFLYFSAMTWGGEALPRTVFNILPVACMAAGETMASIHRFLEKRFSCHKNFRPVITGLLSLLFLFFGFARQNALGITASGYSEASDFFKKEPRQRLMILGLEPIWRFYLGRVAYEPYNRPKTLRAALDIARREGIKYLIVDYSTLHSKYRAGFTRDFLNKAEPVAVFLNPRGTAFAYLLDEYGLYKAEKISRDNTSGKIYIFSLPELLKRYSL